MDALDAFVRRSRFEGCVVGILRLDRNVVGDGTVTMPPKDPEPHPSSLEPPT